MSLREIDTDTLNDALRTLNTAFSSLPVLPASSDVASAHAEPAAASALREGTDPASVLHRVAERLQDNYPYHHPNYAGQMLKPPHPVAQLAYTLAQSINPNNHALDGGRASSAMEKEAVAHIAAMVGWGRSHLGHLCSGGTVANLEALWVARELGSAQSAVFSSEFSHYTHARLSSVLGVTHQSVSADGNGRMNLDALCRALDSGPESTVVATLGTTSFGSVDPLAELVALRERYHFRLHVDAAYGGYFKLLPELPRRIDFSALEGADSIVIDPHKHGLQPYGCGCVLFANPEDGAAYAHDSPYTYFTSDELHLGEISLECSRPGAAAVALWATQQSLPNVEGGRFAQDLSRCREAAIKLHGWLQLSDAWDSLLAPDLDIVVWIPRARSISEASARSLLVFEELAKRDIHIAQLKVPAEFAVACVEGLVADEDMLTCLRVSLMKPEHREWIDFFIDTLAQI